MLSSCCCVGGGAVDVGVGVDVNGIYVDETKTRLYTTLQTQQGT